MNPASKYKEEGDMPGNFLKIEDPRTKKRRNTRKSKSPGTLVGFEGDNLPAEESPNSRNAQVKGKKKKKKRKSADKKLDEKIAGKKFMSNVGVHIRDRRMGQIDSITDEIKKASEPYMRK